MNADVKRLHEYGHIRRHVDFVDHGLRVSQVDVIRESAAQVGLFLRIKESVDAVGRTREENDAVSFIQLVAKEVLFDVGSSNVENTLKNFNKAMTWLNESG